MKGLARKMFRIVAEAESKAHGLPIEQVHFHEVGAIDSIVDIVSVAVCLDNLGIEEVIVSPLAEGSGYVKCQHGTLPVPVPATSNIAAAYGLKMRLTDNDGEMVTPTGAAIAAAVRTGETLPDSYRILKIGIGAGNKEFKRANILRAMLIQPESGQEASAPANTQTAKKEDPAAGCPSERMTILETNIDDGSGEMLGLVMELLLEAGASDVWHTPIYMKKNRPAYMLSVLCREELREQLEDIIFSNTTTIGIRRFPAERTVLERRKITVDTPYGPAEVKVCSRGGRTFCYPEYESIRNICLEQGGRADFGTVYHAVVEAAAKAQNL